MKRVVALALVAALATASTSAASSSPAAVSLLFAQLLRGEGDLPAGRIWVESVEGKGSSFFIVLPILTETAHIGKK